MKVQDQLEADQSHSLGLPVQGTETPLVHPS